MRSDSHPPARSAQSASIIPPGAAPLVIVEGKGAVVKDRDGKAYIDLEAGPAVSTVGHCHPRIVAAIREQAGKLLHCPGAYLTDLSISLVQRLSKLTGGVLNRTFFSNSGAEANDGAVKLALKHAIVTGKQGLGIISFEHAFHGRLSLPLSLTGMVEMKKGFGPYTAFPGVVQMPAPYCYRCPLALKPESCGGACVDIIEERLKTSVVGDVAILIAEPILGSAGIFDAPVSYWSRIKQLCDRYRITLILDEVFTGFGRTGKMFAHQHYGITPQIMSFAKTIGGGTPFGGFTARPEIGESFERGDHNSTYGVRNQIGLAAAHAVLDTIEEENLIEASNRQGKRFANGLRELAKRHECIGDIRGKGLMIGVELVTDREKRTHATALGGRIPSEMAKRGVLLQPTGVNNNTLRITPPLVITDDEVDAALDRFDDCLTSIAGAA